MIRPQVEKRVDEQFRAGFHCAEAVAQAIVEFFGQGPVQALPGAATAFGGGLGRSHEDTCGALNGGVLALGCLMGRREPGADWGGVAELAAEFRRRFIREMGSTNCRAILERLGPQENSARCRELSVRTAGLLAELLVERGRPGPA